MKTKLLILSSIFILLITASIVWLYYFWGREGQTIFLEKKMASLLDRPVTIQEANLQIFPRIQVVLHMVNIKHQDGKSDFISLEKLRLGVSLRHLFTRTIYFHYLILEHPRLTVSREKGKDFSELLNVFYLRKKAEENRTQWLKKFQISLGNLIVRKGEIEFRDCAVSDPPPTFRFFDLDLQTGKISSAGLAPVLLKGALQSGKKEARINLKGKMGLILEGSKIATMRFIGDLEVTDFSLSSLELYLFKWKKIESPQGIVSGKFSFNGILGGDFDASGKVDIIKLKLKNEKFPGKKLKIDKTQLQFTLNQNKKRLTFTDIRLKLPELTATGKFSVDKTCIPLIEAELKTGNFDYQAILPYFPFPLFPSKIKNIMTNEITAGEIDKLFFRYSERPSGSLQSPPDKKTKTVEGNLCFRDFSIKVIDEVPPFEHLNGALSFKNKALDITDLTGTIGHSEIKRSSITISKSGLLNLSGNFELDLLEVNNLLHLNMIPSTARDYLEKIQSLKGKGLLTLNASGPLNDLDSITFGGELKLLDAEIDYRNFFKPGKKLTGTIQFTPDTIKINDIQGLWANSPFTCWGRIKNYRSSASQLNVHVESENAEINDLASAFFPWKGVEGQGVVNIKVDFSCFGYRTQNLRFLGQSTFQDLTLIFPAFPHPFTNINGEMGFSSDGLTFPKISFKTGSSEISLSIICTPLRHPQITGGVNGTFVNFLDLYKPPKLEEQKPTVKLRNVALTINNGCYKDLSFKELEATLDYQDGVLHIPSLIVNKGKFRGFDFIKFHNTCQDRPGLINYHSGVATIPCLRLESQGGIWVGKDIRLPLWSEEEEEFSLTSEMQNISMEEFLQGFPSEKRKFTGRLNMNAKILGKGKTFSECLNTLNGEAIFTIENGVIKKAQILSKIFSLLNVSRIFRQDYSKLLINGLPYEIIQGDFQIQNGVAKTDSLFLDSPSMRMDAVGEIDLGKKFVDLEIAVQPLETVDKVVGKIPILGTVLMGDEGAVVITYYKLTGPFENTKLNQVVFTSLGRKGQGIFKRIFKLPETILNWNGKGNSKKNNSGNKSEEGEGSAQD